MEKEEINRIRELVSAQIIESLGYLPNAFRWSMRACLIIVLAYTAFFLVCHKKPSVISVFQFALRLIWLFTFVTYSYCVLQLTILSRTPIPRYDHIDWIFLSRWFDSDEQKAFYIANIVMFIPLGILLPMAGRPMQHIIIAAPVATICSIGIEAVQLKYHLGACQLDDVLLNSFGFLIGFLVYLTLADIYGLLSAIVKFQK